MSNLVFLGADNQIMTTSLTVAQVFGKRHKDVLRDIHNLTVLVSKEFAKLNFELSSYKSEQNKELPCYNLTRDGFTLLFMIYVSDQDSHKNS